MHVQRLVANAGVWRLLTSTMAFGEITVASPSVLVDHQRDGQVTLARAFQPRQPSPPTVEPAGPLPAPPGRPIAKGGTVKLVREGAGSYEVTDLNGQVDLKTLDEVVGKIDLTLADGSKLAGETNIRQLVSRGKVSSQNASGTFRVRTDRNVKMGPLAALAGQAGLDGGVNLDVDATLDAGKLQGRFALGVAGVQSAQRAAANATPINAELRAQARWADNKLTANFDLAGEAGEAKAELTYQRAPTSR